MTAICASIRHYIGGPSQYGKAGKIKYTEITKEERALAGVAQWIEPKGRQFNLQSGHMPVLCARSPVGGARRQPHIDVSLSLSPSLSLCLKINKIFKNKYN